MATDTNAKANAFQGSIYDAYDFYKRNYASAQDVISSTGFESVQNMSANIASRFRPTTIEGTQTMSTEATSTTGTTTTSSITSTLTSPSFLKGLLIGAGLTYVATNPTIQKAVVTGAVNLFTALQGSIEEVKEQIQDAKEELSQTDE